MAVSPANILIFGYSMDVSQKGTLLLGHDKKTEQ